MKEQYISELRDADRVASTFAVRVSEVRLARTGEPYLSMDLADRTGSIGATMFRPGRAVDEVTMGGVAFITGRVSSYRGTRRIVLETIKAIATFDREDLLPVGRRERAELLGYLEFLIGEISDQRMRSLVRGVLNGDGVLERFVACPGSVSRHHAWLGGLLEHTVDVATMCQHAGQLYDMVDRDLLLAAAILHDVGKVDELEFDTSFAYSDAGRLLGHVVLGERRVSAVAAELRSEPERVLKLAHTMVSHHGELEWGSPKRPATLEALILHHVDNLDAKVTGFMESVSGAARADERWTDAKNLFRRPLYVPRSAEDDQQIVPTEDDEYYLAARG